MTVLTRRRFLQATTSALGAGVGATAFWRYRSAAQASVFIAALPHYGAPVEESIRRGLSELGIGREWVRGKSVLLKPNLVEPNAAAPHVSTHPVVVCAAADVFRSWDAREVFVAEGQGHCRDTDWVLEQSGFGPALDEARVRFVDLNTDSVFPVPNKLGKTGMRALWLPQSLRRADLIVSMPKMKTHHWVGVTLSMKNLFGVMPGICYGWPKNVLHQAGIAASILDVNAVVRPHLAIVDGIVGMEGDGPIMGTPRNSGGLVMGANLPAVDATCSRLMGIDPENISYLTLSESLMGPISDHHIEQRGEPVAELTQRYRRPPGNVIAKGPQRLT